MWKSLPTDYCTRLISWLCNDFVTLTTIIDFQGVRKDWNCPPIPEKKSEKTQNLSFSVWLLTRLFFLPSTDHKTLFCWSVPLGLPQASFLQNWREEKKFRVAEIRLQKPKKSCYMSQTQLKWNGKRNKPPCYFSWSKCYVFRRNMVLVHHLQGFSFFAISS